MRSEEDLEMKQPQSHQMAKMRRKKWFDSQQP
jgi:hypothetical protein